MDGGKIPGVALFTSEPPSGGYIAELFLGWVRIARTLTGEDRYYAVTPDFWRDSAKGRFNDSIIILMSCFGFVDDTLGNIFIEKGASVFIGWNEKVTTEHMDRATLVLLETILNGKIPISEAVEYTMQKVGADPIYGSVLKFYTEKMKS